MSATPAYIQVTTNVDTEFKQIIIAELSQIGYDMFEETDNELITYIDFSDFNAELLQEIREKYADLQAFEFITETVEKQNWNALWESNYQPVQIGDGCIIRAPFHEPQSQFAYELIIEPKMSFGTGHHQTTESIIRLLFELDFTQKNVLDMGSGTGMLGILACKMGAKRCLGIDNEAWAVANSQENAVRNATPNFEARLGSCEQILDEMFDITIANINKNIILADIKSYAQATKPNGWLLLSGFFVGDVPDVVAACAKFGFAHHKQQTKENWAALLLKKNDI